jgi:hypothetical protein
MNCDAILSRRDRQNRLKTVCLFTPDLRFNWVNTAKCRNLHTICRQLHDPGSHPFQDRQAAPIWKWPDCPSPVFSLANRHQEAASSGSTNQSGM